MKNILLLILLVSLFSCKEKIDFDLNESKEQLLVVEGRITNQKDEHTVKLSLSGKFYGDVALPEAKGAIVSISDGTTTFDLTEKEAGIYKTDSIKGEVGKKYTLSIEYDGELYTSSATMNRVPKIELLLVAPSLIPGREDELYSILISTLEPLGMGDYYRWDVFLNRKPQSDTLGSYQFSNDDFIDGDSLQPFILQVDLEAEKGDTLKVNQISISNEAYDMYLSSNLETVWRGGIFDSPPSNVPTNISNGALGLWDANAVASAETIIFF